MTQATSLFVQCASKTSVSFAPARKGGSSGCQAACCDYILDHSRQMLKLIKLYRWGQQRCGCVQASQQARAQANNMQRFAPAQTPSAAIAAAGGQPPPGFRLPTAKQQPIGLPSERLGAMGGHTRSSAGN